MNSFSFTDEDLGMALKHPFSDPMLSDAGLGPTESFIRERQFPFDIESHETSTPLENQHPFEIEEANILDEHQPQAVVSSQNFNLCTGSINTQENGGNARLVLSSNSKPFINLDNFKGGAAVQYNSKASQFDVRRCKWMILAHKNFNLVEHKKIRVFLKYANTDLQAKPIMCCEEHYNIIHNGCPFIIKEVIRDTEDETSKGISNIKEDGHLGYEIDLGKVVALKIKFLCLSTLCNPEGGVSSGRKFSLEVLSGPSFRTSVNLQVFQALKSSKKLGSHASELLSMGIETKKKMA